MVPLPPLDCSIEYKDEGGQDKTTFSEEDEAITARYVSCAI
jgi:hypothetical protein